MIHSAPGHPPLGGLGYVLAAEEVMVQARGLGIGFDAVVCASGSALTHAGLLVGSRALGEAVPVYGICVRRDARRQGDRVAQVAAELAGMIERPAAFDAGDVEVSDAVHAPGYGRLNDAVREAMALAARHEALLLDPVYTGKAMAGPSPTCVRGALPRAAACSSCIPADCRRSSPTRTGSAPGSRRRPGRRRADDAKGVGHGRRAAPSAAALASSRTHSRNAWTSGRCREAAVVMRQQPSVSGVARVGYDESVFGTDILAGLAGGHVVSSEEEGGFRIRGLVPDTAIALQAELDDRVSDVVTIRSIDPGLEQSGIVLRMQ